jgi:hypothetical protein
MTEETAILINDWAVAFLHPDQLTVLRFHRPKTGETFSFGFTKANATAMAQAILDQYRNPPPEKSRLS